MTIINKTFACLDKGFVRLVDMMGNDAAIVQAARTSYGKGTKTISEDRSLIRYLMRNRHTSPFEMVELKFHIKLPIFVARQWIRHRTASVNELSARYSELPNEFYMPSQSTTKKQSSDNKQGRSDKGFSEDEWNFIQNMLSQGQAETYESYESLLQKNVARELARINLPLSIYTEWYWKIDLHNLFHFLKLRLDKHAQYEIRVYAEVIVSVLKECVPLAWEAFEDYVLNAMTFSATELLVLKNLLSNKDIDITTLEQAGLGKREADEFLNKINTIKSK